MQFTEKTNNNNKKLIEKFKSMSNIPINRILLLKNEIVLAHIYLYVEFLGKLNVAYLKF